jgi:hypothetical protein
MLARCIYAQHKERVPWGISNPRFIRFAHVIALKTGFLQQMWRITIVPLLAESRYSEIMILVVVNFRYRPEAAI